MNVIRLSLAAILAIALLRAESNPPRVQFEVASLRPSPSEMPNSAAVGLHIAGSQVRANWRPTGPTPSDLTSSPTSRTASRRTGSNEMLQALLEKRFPLRARRGKKELPVYGLVVAKGGLKIKRLPTDVDDTPTKALDWRARGGPDGFSVSFGRGASLSLGNNRLEIKVSMDDFAEALSQFADCPVINIARYDFTVELTPEDYRAIMIRAALNRGVPVATQALQMLDDFSVESTFLPCRRLA